MPTLDVTWGGSISNAYVSLTEADSFLQTTLFGSVWTGITKHNKQVLILTATRSIDQKNWSGGRFFFDQRLEFPRSLVETFPVGTNPSTFSIEWKEMKQRVEQSCSIQAVWEHLRQNEVDYRLIQSQGVSSISQGGGNTNVSVSFRSFAQILHPDVKALLKRWRSVPRVYRG